MDGMGGMGGHPFSGGQQMSPEEAEKLFKQMFGDDMQAMMRDMAKMQREMGSQGFHNQGNGGHASTFQGRDWHDFECHRSL